MKKTMAATRPKCSPEMASRWARPASRMAAVTSSPMAPRSPVSSAAATAAASPSRFERIRVVTRWRRRPMVSCQSRTGSTSSGLIGRGVPKANPTAPRRAK